MDGSKIKNRGKPLIVTPSVWNKITGHLNDKKNQQEMAEKELIHKKLMKEGSRNMVKNWNNSIEKMRQRRMEEHEQKLKKREDNLNQSYSRLRREQVEERNQVVDAAKKSLNMKQERTIQLNSAMCLSETLFERQLQLNFQKMERGHEKREEAKYARLVKFNAEQEAKENAEKIQKLRERNYMHAEDLKEQIKNREAEKRKEEEERMKKELEENKMRNIEIKAVADYEYELLWFNQDQQKKLTVRQQALEDIERREQIENEQKIQNEIEDKLNDIYKKAKSRNATRKKLTPLETIEKEFALKREMCKKLEEDIKQLEEENAKVLESQIAEFEDRQMEILEKNAQYKKKLLEDRLEYRRKVVQEREGKEEREREREKWKMAHRLKTKEIMDKYNQDKTQHQSDEKILYREQLDQQIKENDTSEYDEMIKQSEQQFYQDKWASENTAFRNHANELMDIMKLGGKNTIPIQKVINRTSN